MNRKRGLSDGKSCAIASDGGRLKYEFASGARRPVRGVVDGVAGRNIMHVGAIGAHDSNAGLASFALHHASQRFLTGTCGQAAYAEIGGMQETEFVGGTLSEEENATDLGRGEAVKKLAGFAATADAGDVDADVGRVVGSVASPEEPSGHEFRTSALGLPGVTVVDLRGALANGFSELAIDGADGIVAQLDVELALREISVRMGHDGSRVADESGQE